MTKPTTAAAAMAKLIVERVDRLPMEVEIEHEAVIGRSTECMVQVDDKRLSRSHCRVERSRDGWIAIDLTSKNGTYVNGKRIKSIRLTHGDELRAGDTRITFREHNGVSEDEVTLMLRQELSDDSVAGRPMREIEKRV